MTLEKAIKLIHPETSKIEVSELEYYSGFNEDKILSTLDEAIELVCKSAENEIPDKVIEVHNLEHKQIMYICPKCNVMLSKGVKYCDNCGKKMIWK